MIDRRPQADCILVAQLTGEVRHHAKWRELSEAEEAAAVADLRELAEGRADLLAEVAGILEGASEGELGEPLARQAAGLCRKAGADPEAIAAWIEEGRRRRANAGPPPFSDPRRRRPDRLSAGPSRPGFISADPGRGRACDARRHLSWQARAAGCLRRASTRNGRTGCR